MPVTEIVRIQTVVTGVAGSPYYMRGYFDATNGSVPEMQSAWHAFVTGGSGATSTGFPTGSEFTTQSEAIVINPVTGDPVQVIPGVTTITAGTGSLELLPRQTQGLCRWRTGIYVGGREVRGRTNLPMMTENLNTAQGTPDPVFVNAVNARAGTLIDDPETTFVVWAKSKGQWQPATSGSCWNQWATLRSRRD